MQYLKIINIHDKYESSLTSDVLGYYFHIYFMIGLLTVNVSQSLFLVTGLYLNYQKINLAYLLKLKTTRKGRKKNEMVKHIFAAHPLHLGIEILILIPIRIFGTQ